MDTYDVSGLAEYEELMKRQKHTLEAARARQGEAPKDRRSRQQLVDTFMMQYTMHKLRELQPSNQFQLHSSFVPPPYLPSIAPLEKLKQLFIKDLRLETHHRGKYLLLQSITPPNRMTAIMAIMEDEKTDVVMLQLYQQPVEKDRPATESLNERDVVLIKEPYFKIMGDGEYGLRVDHVSDIIRIEENDGKIPLQWRKRIMNLDKTANDWKLEGNDAMKREQYWSAVIR